MAKKRPATVKAFVKRAKSDLVCSRRTKETLSDELQSELLDQFGDLGASLPDDYAAPEEIARQLQQSVDPGEVLRAKRRARRLFVSLAATAAVILLFLIISLVMAINNHDVVVTERIPGYTYSVSSSSN